MITTKFEKKKSKMQFCPKMQLAPAAALCSGEQWTELDLLLHPQRRVYIYHHRRHHHHHHPKKCF